MTRRTWTRRQGLVVLLAAPLGLPAAVAAGSTADPDARHMIEALRPGTATTRNLVIRPAAAAAVAVPPTQPAPAVAAAAPPPGALPPTAPQPAGAEAAAPAPSLSLAIQFDSNSARVRPESGVMLGNLVAAMQSPELRQLRFVIEGHTDARGSAQSNQQLSQARAEEVRLYLVALGVHPARLRAVGKGASEPVAGTDPQSAENRRVRVVTLE